MDCAGPEGQQRLFFEKQTRQLIITDRGILPVFDRSAAGQAIVIQICIMPVFRGGGESMSPNNERRKGMAPVPENLNEILKDAQLLSLHKLEGFGWNLEFVRRPLFQEVVPVLCHPDNGALGVMRDDGTLNMQPDIQLRG